MVKYKQRCVVCKEKWALVERYRQQPICKDCEKRLLEKPVVDKEYKKMLDINPKFYDESGFLRSIRMNYSRYGYLTDKQKEFFKKVVDELKNPKKKEKASKETKKES